MALSCVVGVGPTLPTLPLPEWKNTAKQRRNHPSLYSHNGRYSSIPPGKQQVQVNVLIRPGLEPETSQPQRGALPLDHVGLRGRSPITTIVVHY